MSDASAGFGLFIKLMKVFLQNFRSFPGIPVAVSTMSDKKNGEWRREEGKGGQKEEGIEEGGKRVKEGRKRRELRREEGKGGQKEEGIEKKREKGERKKKKEDGMEEELKGREEGRKERRNG